LPVFLAAEFGKLAPPLDERPLYVMCGEELTDDR
jgi:hypothetical protein